MSPGWISREKLTSPCWARWRVGSGLNELIMNLTMDPPPLPPPSPKQTKETIEEQIRTLTRTMRWGHIHRTGLIFFCWSLEMKHCQSLSYHHLLLTKASKPWSQEDWDRSSDSEIEPSWWHAKQKNWSFLFVCLFCCCCCCFFVFVFFLLIISFVVAWCHVSSLLFGWSLIAMHPMRMADRGGTAPYWLGAAQLEAGDRCPLRSEDLSHPWRRVLRQSSDGL